MLSLRWFKFCFPGLKEEDNWLAHEVKTKNPPKILRHIQEATTDMFYILLLVIVKHVPNMLTIYIN